MKVLYATQATGNGHLARALHLVPALEKHFDVEVLVSGYQSDLTLPFPVRHKVQGLSYRCNSKGEINFWESIAHFNLGRFIKDLITFPKHEYDFIINDFEPLSAWLCKFFPIPIISVSHQGAYLFPNVPLHPKKSKIGVFALKYYAPCSHHIGLHFQAYHPKIVTPIIRKEIWTLSCNKGNAYNVYLPFYDDTLLIKQFSRLIDERFNLFSKKAQRLKTIKNCILHPISSEGWINHLSTSKGVIMGAGFEGPSECIHLGKKLMVVPLSGQYEQLCNAQTLKEMGIKTINTIDDSFIDHFQDWENWQPLHIKYPDPTQKICELIKDFSLNCNALTRKRTQMISSNSSS